MRPRDGDGTTHYEGCWRDLPKHAECKGFKDGYAAGRKDREEELRENVTLQNLEREIKNAEERGYEKARDQAAKLAEETAIGCMNCNAIIFDSSASVKIREMKSS